MKAPQIDMDAYFNITLTLSGAIIGSGKYQVIASNRAKRESTVRTYVKSLGIRATKSIRKNSQLHTI